MPRRATLNQFNHAAHHAALCRTSVVIAQRISTVLNADKIIVLEKGQIVAQGRHADLIEESAIYAEIYRSQLVEDPTTAPVDKELELML